MLLRTKHMDWRDEKEWRLIRCQNADQALSRGEALRQAMMALMDGQGYLGADGKTIFAYAHPLFWAPYTIIGDGGV